MSVDVDKARLDVGDAMRIGRGLRLAQQCGAFEIGRQHHVDKAFGSVGRFLRQTADPPFRRNGDQAALQRRLSSNRLEQGRFSGAVAADQADVRAGHDLHRAVVDQQPARDADGNIVDGKHDGFSPRSRENATPERKQPVACCRCLMIRRWLRAFGSLFADSRAILPRKLVEQSLKQCRMFRIGGQCCAQPFADAAHDGAARSGVELDRRGVFRVRHHSSSLIPHHRNNKR